MQEKSLSGSIIFLMKKSKNHSKLFILILLLIIKKLSNYVFLNEVRYFFPLLINDLHGRIPLCILKWLCCFKILPQWFGDGFIQWCIFHVLINMIFLLGTLRCGLSSKWVPNVVWSEMNNSIQNKTFIWPINFRGLKIQRQINYKYFLKACRFVMY